MNHKILIALSLLVCLNLSGKAQDANLSETQDFIKIKIIGCSLWYNEQINVTTSNCSDGFPYFFDKIAAIEFRDKSIVFTTNKCSEKAELKINLSLVKSADIRKFGSSGGNAFTLVSTEPFFSVIYKGNVIKTELSNRIVFLGTADANDEKLQKAFKHLFKLLNIKLVEDKF